MITSISTKIDHVLKLVYTTYMEDNKSRVVVESYDGTKFNPAEFSNFSYDIGGGKIIKVR